MSDLAISGDSIKELAEACIRMGHPLDTLTPEVSTNDDGSEIWFRFVRIERDGGIVYVGQRNGCYDSMEQLQEDMRQAHEWFWRTQAH